MKRVPIRCGTARPANSSRNCPKSSRSAKAKSKTFQPLQYLNSLIDQLHDHRFNTTKKRPVQAKRDISSALTAATPNLDKTISVTKLRSKSSHSQYRKRSQSVMLKDIMQVEVNKMLDMVTQEDVVRFTEETVHSARSNGMNDPDNTQLYRANESDNSNELKQHYAACRIQRTWRNYQTLKIVRKHYEYYRALMRREKEERSVWREAGNRLGRNSGRNVVGERSIEKSTKESMEKRRSGREPERRIAYDKYGREGASWSGESEQQIIGAVDWTKARGQKIGQKDNKGKDIDQISNTRKHHLKIKRIASDEKTKEIKNEEHNSAHKQPSPLKIANLMASLERSQLQLQQQIDSGRKQSDQCYEVYLRTIKPEESSALSLTCEHDFEQFHIDKPHNCMANSTKTLENSQLALGSENTPQLSLYLWHDITLQRNYLKGLQSLNQLFHNSTITAEEHRLKQEQLIGRYLRRKRDNQRAREHWESSVSKLRQDAIDFHKQWLRFENSFGTGSKQLGVIRSTPIRRCFSSQSIIAKCIISQGALEFSNLQSTDGLANKHSNKGKSHNETDLCIGIKPEELQPSHRPISPQSVSIRHNNVQADIVSRNQFMETLAKAMRKQQTQQDIDEVLPQPNIRTHRRQQSSQLADQSAIEQFKEPSYDVYTPEQKLQQEIYMESSSEFLISSEGKQKGEEQQEVSLDGLQSVDAFEEKLLDSSRKEETLCQGSQESCNPFLDQNEQLSASCSSHSSEAESIEILDDTPESPGQLSTLRHCTQHLQRQIETMLINQFVQQSFQDDQLYRYFQYIVQSTHKFAKISDEEIMHFITSQIQQFFEPEQVMLGKINQKINPNTLEILRLIRDYEFEIDQYELIISEEVFKNYRKQLEDTFRLRMQEMKKGLEERPKDSKMTPLQRKVEEKEIEKCNRNIRYICFERDLRIMYLKAVFNCLNEFLIECKSSSTFINARSSIGPGELKLALKEYNQRFSPAQSLMVLQQAQRRIAGLLRSKCMIPSFRNYKDLQVFQKQIVSQLKEEFEENEYKWVNYMDEVLEIWQDLGLEIIELLITEASQELLHMQPL